MIFKHEIVFVKIILPLIAGITVAYFVQTEAALKYSLYSLCVLFIIACSSNFFYKKFKIWHYKKLIFSLYFALFFSLGSYLCLSNTDFLQKNYFAKQNFQQLKIIINNEPQLNDDILRFEAKVTDGYKYKKAVKVSGKLLIALKIDSIAPIQLNYGDELIIKANYLEVEPPYNPYEFNFKKWLATKNIYQQAFIHQNQMVVIRSNAGNPIISYALSLRQKQINIYRSIIKDDEAFAVASTLILGYRADLNKETLEAYSKTGTIHALSVSGMHVGIIYIMLNFIFSFLDKKRIGKILKVTLIVVLIWAYALITGFSPSVLRAAIMLSFYIFSKQFKRNNNTYNILASAAFLILIYNPFLLWDVGFQLSFISVFGLIYFQPKIYNCLYFKNKILDQLWNIVALSLAAQIVTMPLSVYYFHQFPLLFIISNLFILIPVTLMMYIGITILILKTLFLAPIFEWIIIFNNKGLKWLSNLPFANISEIWINIWQMLLISMLIFFLTLIFVYRIKWSIYACIFTVLVLQTSFSYSKITQLFQQEILFFSLRKNYAIAFIKGKEAILVTDLESNNKNYTFFVKSYLDKKSIKKLHFIKWDENFNRSYFTKNNSQINFLNFNFLLLDSSFNHKKIKNNPRFNFVWLHQNVKYKIQDLNKEIDFKTLLIDASNKDYYSTRAKYWADSLNIPVLVLKKQESVTLNIN